MEHRGSSDAPQRTSSTKGSSEGNGVQRPVVERNPKFEDRRSPRSTLSEVMKKKGGTKVADLESKLGKAQEELKKLRDRLASAEAAKDDAEHALQKAKKQITGKEIEEQKAVFLSTDSRDPSETKRLEASVAEECISSVTSTDFFNALVPKDKTKTDENECESKRIDEETKREEGLVAAKNAAVEIELNSNAERDEVVELRSKLSEKEKEVEILMEENLIFKTKVKEESERIASAARAKEEELVAKLKQMEEELIESRTKTEQLGDQLKSTEIAKSTIEADMRRMRVQTEQWRKAAEAAAAVMGNCDSPLRIETEGGRRVTERCGSMDKHLSSGGDRYFS